MAFTYLGTLATDLDNVRFEINDKVASAGPLPNSANFTDAELNALITREGSWGAGAAAACETLARAWAPYANIRTGSRGEDLGDRSKVWAEHAQTLRAQYGGGPSLRAGVIGLDFQEKDE